MIFHRILRPMLIRSSAEGRVELTALRKNMPILTEFQNISYGRAAPLKRNEQMVDLADSVLVIWDGRSKGTEYTIKYSKRVGKPLTVIEVAGER